MNAPYTGAGALVADQSGATKSAVAWAAILAGTAVAISMSVVLLLLGSGLGFSALRPSNHATAPALAAAATVWIIVVQWLSAAVGGYLTGRLRTRWAGTHSHEIFFRDTAHGLVMWATATALVVIAVASAGSSLLAAGVRTESSAPMTSVAAYDVDALFRTTREASQPDPRGEATVILGSGMSTGSFPDSDRTYLANLVAARTGVAQADAQTRVDEIVARLQEKTAAARKAAATTALMNALAMLVGAFVACAAAALGGRERDLHP
ncbi:MAG: hypothetical protein PVS2B3_03500 [Steroidobacteraceae bacterium]